MPLKIFICYAHEDEALLKKLKGQLTPLYRQGLIEVWHDRAINAGSEWEREIDTHLNAADIILLLVSPDFMASDYCYGVEMQRAMERYERGEAQVIPIILHPVYWQGAPFGKLQALPTDAKPVMSSNWHYQDEAFLNVIEGIRKVVEELILKSSIPLPVPPNPPLKPESIQSSLNVLKREPPKPLHLVKSERKKSPNLPLSSIRSSPVKVNQTPWSILLLALIAIFVMGLYLLGTFLPRSVIMNSITFPYTHMSASSRNIPSYLAVAWSPDAKHIAYAGKDGKVDVWDTSMKHAIYTYKGHKGAVKALAWSHDGTRIASAGEDHTVQVWIATNGQKIITYTGHKDTVNAVAWSPHDTRIASASDDNTVRVWDVVDGVTVYTFFGHHAAVSAVAWSPHDTRIASAAADVKNEVQIWDATTGNNVITYSTTSTSAIVDTVAWSQDNTRIAFDVANSVQIRDIATMGKVVSIVCSGHQDNVNTVAWSPDSRYVASGSDDKTVRICDSTTGSTIVIYRGHSGAVNVLEWASNGMYIASGSDDGTVQVWNALSGSHLFTFH